MLIGACIQGWRLARKQSIELLSSAADLPHDLLEQIEADQTDPTVGTIEALARALRVPPSWLFDDPEILSTLFNGCLRRR